MIEELEIKKIDAEKIKEKAEDYYRKLEYYCSEAIVQSFIDELDLSLPDDVIAMASGFPLGLGQSGCSCGAVTGGVMILGYFFGRRKPKDTKVFHAMKLAKELHDYFQDEHGSVCCKVLTKDLKFMSKEHMEQCISFTGEVAKKVAEMIKREFSKN